MGGVVNYLQQWWNVKPNTVWTEHQGCVRNKQDRASLQERVVTTKLNNVSALLGELRPAEGSPWGCAVAKEQSANNQQ